MSGILIEIGAPSGKAVSAREHFLEVGFGIPIEISRPNFRVQCYPRITHPEDNSLILPDGRFICTAGSLFLGATRGSEALGKLLERFDGTDRFLEGTRGHFLIVVGGQEQLHLFRDRNGAYEVYADSDDTLISTSFLALARTLDRPKIDRQAVYEYVFNGVTLGDATLLRDVRKLAIDETLHFQDGLRRNSHGWPLVPEQSSASRGTLLEALRAKLTDIVGTAATACGTQARLALSGGYDSRLLVASLRRAGIRPQLYVYGSARDSDVRVAQKIAEGETFALEHLDKENESEPAPDQYPELVRKNWLIGDGAPWGGIFNRGAEHRARAQRHRDGLLLLNGGGGEILRNFFYLPDRPVRPVDLAYAFYSQFDPTTCRQAFSRASHLQVIAEKIAQLPGFDGGILPRRLAEAAYPHFRCRSWNGRESTGNSRFGPWLLPFYDYEVTQLALSIPIHWKYYGDFEAELIRITDPPLAAYPSNYGSNFERGADWRRRLRTQADYLQPPWLRQYRFAIKQRLLGPLQPAKWLSAEYAGRVIDLKLPVLSELFDVAQMRHADQHVRVLTLEYLFQSLHARLD